MHLTRLKAWLAREDLIKPRLQRDEPIASAVRAQFVELVGAGRFYDAWMGALHTISLEIDPALVGAVEEVKVNDEEMFFELLTITADPLAAIELVSQVVRGELETLLRMCESPRASDLVVALGVCLIFSRSGQLTVDLASSVLHALRERRVGGATTKETYCYLLLAISDFAGRGRRGLDVEVLGELLSDEIAAVAKSDLDAVLGAFDSRQWSAQSGIEVVLVGVAGDSAQDERTVNAVVERLGVLAKEHLSDLAAGYVGRDGAVVRRWFLAIGRAMEVCRVRLRRGFWLGYVGVDAEVQMPWKLDQQDIIARSNCGAWIALCHGAAALICAENGLDEGRTLWATEFWDRVRGRLADFCWDFLHPTWVVAYLLVTAAALAESEEQWEDVRQSICSIRFAENLQVLASADIELPSDVESLLKANVVAFERLARLHRWDG